MSPAVIALRARKSESAFGEALLDGLFRMPKRIPAKFFYDAAGSELFEQITALQAMGYTMAQGSFTGMPASSRAMQTQ